MIYPSADTIEKMVGSRYSLVILAAKRAKQIKEGAPVLIDTASTNPLTIALEEIAAGKVTVTPATEITPTHEGERHAEPALFTSLGDDDGARNGHSRNEGDQALHALLTGSGDAEQDDDLE